MKLKTENTDQSYKKVYFPPSSYFVFLQDFFYYYFLKEIKMMHDPWNPIVCRKFYLGEKTTVSSSK